MNNHNKEDKVENVKTVLLGEGQGELCTLLRIKLRTLKQFCIGGWGGGSLAHFQTIDISVLQ